VAALLVTGGWWAQQRARAKAWAAAVYSLRGRVVAVDPGHGGIDPGAIAASGTNEDTVVLAVSLRVAAMLQQAGAIVVLTRTGDSDLAAQTEGGPTARKRVDLRSRVALINASAADVVVSIHANHFSNPAEHGAQTFYNAQRFRESKELATVMQEQFQRVTGETRRVISEHIDHYVLNHADMPGVTVEIGFLSNPREARMLAEPGYQERIAFAIYRALALWFARLPQAPSPAPSTPAVPGATAALAPGGGAVPGAVANPY
jgi:N-acetylmuramoyl-L-alanine amidase